MKIFQRIQHLLRRGITLSSRHMGFFMIRTLQKGQNLDLASGAFARILSMHSAHRMWPHSTTALRQSGSVVKQMLQERDVSSNNLRKLGSA